MTSPHGKESRPLASTVPVENAGPPLPSLSTRTMLEGLARAHPLVIAVDESRRLAWISNELGLVFSDAEKNIGQPVDRLLAGAKVANSSALQDRARAFVDELHETGHVAAARFDLGIPPDILPIEVSAFRVEAEDGRLLSVCIASRLAPGAPIAAEKEPVDPNSRLAVMLDSTPDGVLSIDRLGFITSANAAAAHLLGHPPDQLTGQPITRFVEESVGDVNIAKSIVRSVAANGTAESEEMRILRANGESAWISIVARKHRFVRTDASESTEIIVFMRDVSERRAAHEALVKKNEELESYVRNVSHDLRSPLTSLIGFTRLLREDYQAVLETTGRQFLGRIEEAGRNMERLLQDMLKLSRIGSTPQHPTRVDPRAVLTQLASELKLRLDEANIELTIPKDPPAIQADRTHLYQLFSNLIGNAVVHMDEKPEPRKPSRIDVEIESLDGGWLLSVADDGPGIALEDQQRIFEMFETARAQHEGRTSSGLGLAIVKKIVESHAGKVWVESAPGCGACFKVFLPDPGPNSSAS